MRIGRVMELGMIKKSIGCLGRDFAQAKGMEVLDLGICTCSM